MSARVKFEVRSVKPEVFRAGVCALTSGFLLLASNLTPAAQYAIPTKVYAIFQPYESGDYDVVVRALSGRGAYQALQSDFARAREMWKKSWRRIHAVFLLEVAVLASRQSWPDHGKILADALAFLAARPTFPLPGSGDDIFEILWHRGALAVLQGGLNSRMIGQYLGLVDDRIGATPATREIKLPSGLIERRARLVEPRLALIRAMAAEITVLPDVVRQQTIMTPRGPVSTTLRVGTTPAEVDDILRGFSEAGAFDVNRVEAAVRRANVLIRTNRAEVALAALEAHTGALPDELLRYWRDLMRGRALDVLDRLDEAAIAYGDARALAPTAQSPLLALGVLRFRQGNLAEAQHFTNLVRSLPADAVDPWSLYWHGDSRFFRDVLTRLREMAK